MFIGIIQIAKAQDFVLSQPFTAAQYLSPASVGNGVYDQRIQSNFRNESIGGSNYGRNLVVGWDRKYNRNAPEQANYFGIGGQIMSEQLMDGLINTNYITFNTAYHLFLDGDDFSNLAIGMGITYAQTLLDRSRLKFGNSYNPINKDFDPTDEIFLPNAGRLNVNTGLLYVKHSYDSYFQLSANGFFFAKPVVTNSPYNEPPGMRTAVFMNLERYFNGDYTFLLHGAFSNRNKENSYFVGGSVSMPIKIEFDHDRRLYLGCFYRQNDAIVPTVNILMDNYIFGISYDIYSNPLAAAASMRSNSFELTFSKSFGKRKQELMRTLFD